MTPMTISAHVTLQDKEGKEVLERNLTLPIPMPDLIFFSRKAYVRIAVSGGTGDQGKATGRMMIFRESSGHLMLNDIPGQQTVNAPLNPIA